MDFLNGLAACPTHDAAFDSLLFGVNSELKIVLSPALQRAVEFDPVIARNFGVVGMSATLILPLHASAPGPTYLGWHADEAAARE